MTLGLAQHPIYPTLLERLRSPPSPKLLDLGTCLGQDLRKLTFDGAPLDRLYGADIFPEYESLGQKLFRDEDRFQHRFIEGDLFDDTSENRLAETKGTWNIVSIVMFLHIWDWDRQVDACKRILKLLKPHKGSLIIGSQTGLIGAKKQLLKPPHVKPGEERYIYRHSPDTFRKLWDEVQQHETLSLKVEVESNSAQARASLAKEEESGSRGAFFPSSDRNMELKLFFTVEIL